MLILCKCCLTTRTFCVTYHQWPIHISTARFLSNLKHRYSNCWNYVSLVWYMDTSKCVHVYFVLPQSIIHYFKVFFIHEQCPLLLHIRSIIIVFYSESFINPSGNSIAQRPRQTQHKRAYQEVENISVFLCTRHCGVLAGFIAKGQSWRNMARTGNRKAFFVLVFAKIWHNSRHQR
jgi:hypothetical protein